MSLDEVACPLSAVGLRLTDEVGHAVLAWAAAGDLALSAALDQNVAAVRAALAACQPAEPRSAWLAGHAAHQAARSPAALPHHARRHPSTPPDPGPVGPGSVTLGPVAPGPVTPGPVAPATAEIACPDAPFADSPWQADTAPPLRLLLHYACGFVEAAVRADWWPGDNKTANGAPDFESVRLAAVCRLVRQAEAVAALPPDLR
jgi:hypothetical protein